MSGDWIKMRADLHTHPKVVRISSALKADRLRVIGALHATWCLFDAHSVDGELDGYTLDAIDDLIGWKGFAQAMSDVSWMEVSAHSLALPSFDTHNGQSAKRRAMEADRKASARDADKKRTAVQLSTGQIADKVRTREEKNKSRAKEDSARNADSTEEARAAGQARVVPDESGTDPDAPVFTPAGRVCRAMRLAGLASANPGDPRLLELLKQGATEDEFVGLAAEAVEKSKGFAWVMAVLQSRRAEAAAIALAPKVTTHVNGEVQTTQAYLEQLSEHREEATPERKAEIAERLRMARERITSVAANAPPAAGIQAP